MSSRLLGIAADVLRSFGSAFGGRHLAIVGGAVPALLVLEVPSGIAPHSAASTTSSLIACDSCHDQLRQTVFFEPPHDGGHQPLTGWVTGPDPPP